MRCCEDASPTTFLFLVLFAAAVRFASAGSFEHDVSLSDAKDAILPNGEQVEVFAGSGAGAGAFINDTLPEVTAKALRELE